MNRLLDLREDRDLKQKDVCKLLNISRPQYSRIELEVNKLSHDKLIILSKFYNTSADYILNLTNEIKPYSRIKDNNIRLRELRKNNNYPEKEIAYLLNLSQQQYSSLENGEYNLSNDKLITLADFYNTSIDYILGLTNETKPYPKVEKEN